MAATTQGVIDLSSVIYDVDPVVMVPVGLLIIVLTASLPKSRRLSLRDSLVAFWYLFNGIIIHIFLDGYQFSRSRTRSRYLPNAIAG